MSRIRSVVIDDEALVREALALLLGAEPDIEVVGTTGDGAAAVGLARETEADVVVMDVRMPGVDGVEATRLLAADELDGRTVRVLVLTSFHDDEVVRAALHAGASGFLLKRAAPRHLPDAVRAVAAGNAWLDPVVARKLLDDFAAPLRDVPSPGALARLTPREREVLVLLAHGMRTDDVVTHLVVAEATVKTHVSRVLLKLGLHDRAQAVAFAYRCGLVGPDDPLPRPSHVSGPP
ncbi:response regulator transcription factor [Cellulomonas wangsupingiae]|uniref:Response regulator transcription factor n=1 Tax=Cellulomonas wangsupingiae TaxID=2968085 RepID=A0ABY5K5C0_9CELL|nr:response regulator transcription factor [Cellulomonas wangsupingiae]MCC2334013.1 response regulator transcription factor [Cellulomonas wangsupingiae]UUI65263.1 response regulator transcription factor [Cellulomonas wangsupingiae]